MTDLTREHLILEIQRRHPNLAMLEYNQSYNPTRGVLVPAIRAAIEEIADLKMQIHALESAIDEADKALAIAQAHWQEENEKLQAAIASMELLPYHGANS